MNAATLTPQQAKVLLSDIGWFSAAVTQPRLRRYQTTAIQPVRDSVVHRRGLEFLLVFPRQSGKNEAVAQLLVMLMNTFKRKGGNIIYGAAGNTLNIGLERLEARLTNPWNRGEWLKRARPTRRCLGRCCVLFLSTHPQATARGHTADWLLVIDETQDQPAHHIEAVFTPMRAAHNATALYIGTVKVTSDYLWTKKAELEAETARDGIRRVFMVPPDEVTAEVDTYKTFLDAQVRRHGRNHPIIASEYFLEPMDAAGGLFDDRRLALMVGSHPRLQAPQPNHLYIATLDVAGQDEAGTDPLARLANPARDYTVATVFSVTFPAPGDYAAGPTFDAVDVFVDHGSRHFHHHDGHPPLAHRLLAWLRHWEIAHLIADESGVGQGLCSWLQAALGAHVVTGFDFSPRGAKAALGSAFLALVETGRFHYWTGDQDQPGSDGWWFWQQAAACTYDLPEDGRFDRDLRWGVAPNHKTDSPTGPQLTHDDRLISAALIAQADRLCRAGKLTLGAARSAVVDAPDPLGGDVY